MSRVRGVCSCSGLLPWFITDALTVFSSSHLNVTIDVSMFLDCGRNPEKTQAGGEHVHSTQEVAPGLGISEILKPGFDWIYTSTSVGVTLTLA